MTTENPQTDIKNPFTRMAVQAVKRRWCWNIYCPFCGHAPFRYALLDLASDVYPGDGEWQMEAFPRSREHYVKKWGRQPKDGFPDTWDLMKEAKLAKIMESIDIEEMIQHVSFPELVYVLGIGLFYTQRSEQNHKRITRALTRQLLEKISLNDKGRSYVQEKIKHGECLTWKDMPQLESILRESIGDSAEKLSGTFKFTFKTTLDGFLERFSRRKIVADMLQQYSQQNQFKPRLYAYLLTGDEIILLIYVENRYSFCNGFISHLSSALLARKETEENVQYMIKNGIWQDEFDTVAVDDADLLPRFVRDIENIPVEKEYVAKAEDWLWSSACKHPLVEIDMEESTS